MGRLLDPTVPSNRFAVAGGFIAFIVALAAEVVGNDGFSLWAAISIGAGVFLAWAIGREIDPDHSNTAAIAMGLALLAALTGAPSAGVAVVALLAVRLLAGTTGWPLTNVDVVVVAVAASYGATRPEAWGASLALIIGTAVDARAFARPVLARTALVGLAALIGLWIGGIPDLEFAATDVWWVVAVLVVLGAIVPSPPLSSTTDRGSRVISSDGITAARIAAAAMFLVGVLLGSFTSVAPVGAALASVLVVQLRVRRRV